MQCFFYCHFMLVQKAFNLKSCPPCFSEQDHLEFGNPQEDRQLVKGVANGGFLVLLIENLCRGTTYYFRVTASNATGKSAASEAVQCATLLHGEGIVPGE